MIGIAHRGNLDGPAPERENEPGYVGAALDAGYAVEIDVWWTDGGFALGHDEPRYPVAEHFLEDPRLWCHAKNLGALSNMLRNPRIHCFWHERDTVTLTSRGFVWTYPGARLVDGSVCVLPEQQETRPVIDRCAAVCSDEVRRWASPASGEAGP